jgi:hypothetical protein
MEREAHRWIARLNAASDEALDTLLDVPLALDVWEIHRGPSPYVVAAAEEEVLTEIERRGLARVERLETIAEYLRRVQGSTEG